MEGDPVFQRTSIYNCDSKFCYFFLNFSNVQTLAESEENCIPDRKDEIKEAISWYNRVLGFYIEGGHGNLSYLIVQYFSYTVYGE